MAIEIIPKPTVKIPPWQNFLLYFCLLLLIVSLIGYFMVNRLLNTERAALQKVSESLAQPKSPEEEALESRVLDYQKRVQDFSKLIDEHRYSSKVFPFFEKLCHPRVEYNGTKDLSFLQY